ncbi:hypothetical protein APR11_000384 [Nocardia amikacinitolerans]|uniref:hypothetical protein n=1 Tax=Nocardia amikacinitolerans TaxID=756689 RepID=UPI0020A3C29C|nr:hypothetical protein [Nocardia amikacinitolerans]MCP2293980.1 hypothetical protein [Nocardia amikacinitolerans]
MYSTLAELVGTEIPAPMVLLLGLALMGPGLVGVVYRAQYHRLMRTILRDGAVYDRFEVTETRHVSGGYTRTVKAFVAPPEEPPPPASDPVPAIPASEVP